MIPRLIVHRYKYICLDISEQMSRLAAIHSDLNTIARFSRLSLTGEPFECGFAKIHKGNSDVVLISYFCKLFDIDGVAGEKDDIRATIRGNTEVFGFQNKANAFVAGPMLARRGGDVESLSGDADLSLLPIFKAKNAGSRGKVLCTIICGDNVSAIEKLTAEFIQVVRVVLVAQKNGIDMG
ncbi:hypothetical protein HG530_007849 [Fusarium avenaceum]|nr:hypothetical protein HG530_007849 [Fusarium avenaceum]